MYIIIIFCHHLNDLFTFFYSILRYDHVSREHNNAREAVNNEFNQIKNEQLRRLEIISVAISSLQKLSKDNLEEVSKKDENFV